MPQKTREKIPGKFYPLTPSYTQKLRAAKLTAAEWRIWSYLIELDPWGERYVDLETFRVISECECSKATFYRAIAKFQKLGLFDFQDQGFSFKNEIGSERLRKGYLKNETEILKNETEILKNETEILKNETETVAEPLPDKDSTSLQTIKTFQTPQTGGEEEKTFFSSEEEEAAKENMFTNLKDELLNLNEEKLSDNNSGEDQFSAQPAANRLKSNPQVKEEADQKINEELEEQLRSLEIPLDQVVRKCIEKHHISQVQKAICLQQRFAPAHIENTWEDIRNPRSVFLYQVPKQTVEKPLKNPLTPEFLDWYNKAIAQGIVVDRPAETLPLNHFREPTVILPDGRQVDWQRVRDGDAQPLLSPSESGEFWAGIRNKLNSLASKRKLEHSYSAFA